MTLDEIKSAVDAGMNVRWKNDGYHVFKDRIGQYLIRFIWNDSCIGLTHTNGVTLNGAPRDFYIWSPV